MQVNGTHSGFGRHLFAGRWHFGCLWRVAHHLVYLASGYFPFPNSGSSTIRCVNPVTFFCSKTPYPPCTWYPLLEPPPSRCECIQWFIGLHMSIGLTESPASAMNNGASFHQQSDIQIPGRVCILPWVICSPQKARESLVENYLQTIVNGLWVTKQDRTKK